MQKLKEGDFVNYYFKDNLPSSPVTVKIIKIPNLENLPINASDIIYKLVRLDTNEEILINSNKFNQNISHIEIEMHHLIGLNSKIVAQIQKLNNEFIIFIEFQLENLSFIEIIYTSPISKNIILGSNYLIENKNIQNQEYFNYFFSKNNDNTYSLKNNLNMINNINQLFDKLDSINYHYNKKEIANLKQNRKQQSN